MNFTFLCSSRKKKSLILQNRKQDNQIRIETKLNESKTALEMQYKMRNKSL
jgi:hypothetical protein